MNITLILVIVTAVISYFAFSNEALREKAMFSPYDIKRKNEWYRFISSGFIHADWMHLIFNMLALYTFGEVLERYYLPAYFHAKSSLIYLVLYFGGMVIAGISTYIKQKNNSSYKALGASGAVSAIVFASILFDPLPEGGGIIIFPIPIPIPPVIFGVLYLLYSAYMAKKGGDQINHDAHFYGAVFGFVFPCLLHPELFTNFYQIILQKL